MTDETEVIESIHRADGNTFTDVASGKSPNYTDTEVTSQDRSVTFWNTAHYSDTTLPRQRKILFEIEITGHGIMEIGNAWEEYTSPKASTPYTPTKQFDVPDLGLPQYNFSVKTNYILYDWNGSDWVEVSRGSVPSETAVVNDDSSGE